MGLVFASSEGLDCVMKVTRADVAKLAGVSTATVSYVLNGSRGMSDKTKKLVYDAVKQLNYKPDMIARSMTKNETKQLSLMINDITNPFYSEIVMGFEAAAIEKGYFVNVCTGYKDINNYLDNYIARRIDGVFMVAMPNKFDVQKLYDLVDHGMKVVVSGNTEIDLQKVSSIENDYMAGMEEAVAYLYALGHRKIAYISGLGKQHKSDKKIEGYVEAMNRRGLLNDLLVEGGKPFTTGVEDGYRQVGRLLESGKDFTAVICQNDLMAMGAIAALEDSGRKVPTDVSVMGFDDILFAKAWRPAITTMAVSKYEFGHKAFELLYNNIKKGTPQTHISTLQLKKRESTAACSE